MSVPVKKLLSNVFFSLLSVETQVYQTRYLEAVAAGKPTKEHRKENQVDWWEIQTSVLSKLHHAKMHVLLKFTNIEVSIEGTSSVERSAN